MVMLLPIPDNKYDFVTGNPSQELVEALREKFGGKSTDFNQESNQK